MYDNHLLAYKTCDKMGSNTRRRALADTDGERIIEDRVVLVGNFNADCLG